MCNVNEGGSPHLSSGASGHAGCVGLPAPDSGASLTFVSTACLEGGQFDSQGCGGSENVDPDMENKTMFLFVHKNGCKR